jgi:hypothetical protein
MENYLIMKSQKIEYKKENNSIFLKNKKTWNQSKNCVFRE